MTKSEEMKRLEADMASDKELGKKFYETVDRIATENDQQSDGELFANAEEEEISPEELEQAAGGGSKDDADLCWKDYLCSLMWNRADMDEKGHNGTCITAWHCFTVTLHTEAESHDVNCWKDYKTMKFKKGHRGIR